MQNLCGFKYAGEELQYLNRNRYCVTVLGILYCYAVKKKGDGKDFVTRFICLSVPVTVRIAAGLIVAVMLVYGIGSAIGGRKMGRW